MFENLRTFFDPTGRVAPTYEDLQQRKKIAAAMMARTGRMPKTFGEGLQAIGEAWGDRSYYNKVLEDEQGSRAYEAGKTGSIAEPEAPVLAPYAPAAAAPGPQANAAPAIAVAPGPQAAVAPDAADPWAARSAGIAGIESGGAKDPYSLVGARTRTGDRAIGKYQIMGANVPQWTAAALGQPMTPEQFRASPDAQEATFRHRFGQYVDKYGEEGAARAWYAGEGGMKNPNATDVHGRLTVAGYGGDYLKRLAAAGGNPGAGAAAPKVAAAIAASTSADAPITPDDLAQEERVADVVGMNRGPTNASFFYPQTASRTGDVLSDAPQPGITGAPNGPVRDAIADTIQQRQQALQPPQPATPPPPGPQVVQANVFPNPVVAADGRVAPIIPGGGLPPAPAPAIAKAPEPPSAQIRSAPEAPQVKPMAPPTAPRLQPMVDDYIRQQATIANDPRLSDTTRAMAMKQIEKRQGQIKAVNDQTLTEYNDYRKRYEDQQTPATVYGNEKLRRELEGEGAVPLTADQRKQFAIPESQPAWLTRRGEIKLGPAGQTINVGTDKAQSKGDEELQKKFSERIAKIFDEGDTAGDDLRQLTEMRALAARVGTGAGAVAKQFLGQWGIKTEGLSEIQALQAGIARLIPQQRVPGSGTSSDFDGQLFKEAVVALNKTPEGNNLIFDTMEGLAKNKMARSEIAGRRISGEINSAEAAKELLGLQREARDLSDRVKEHLKATGQDKSVAPAVPKVVSDDQMREFVKNNPNHPKAGEIRRQLGM